MPRLRGAVIARNRPYSPEFEVGAWLAMAPVMLARTKTLGLSLLASWLVLACGAAETTTTVPLLTAAGIPITQTPPGDISLEVVTRSTAVKDPLPVVGTPTSYADLEGAL